MSDLTSVYKDKIDFLEYISQPICKELGIELVIKVPNWEAEYLNAGVDHIEANKYLIKLAPRLFNLHYEIEKITMRYTNDDMLFFRRFKNLSIFKTFEYDTYRDSLNNLFTTFILLQVFIHECGHIQAGHVREKGGSFLEFDSYKEGSFELQEHELVADWLSTGYLFKKIFFYVSKDAKGVKEVLIILKETIALYWLTLTIEFEIFESNHKKEPTDYSKLTHPIPAVRLLYSIEAMHEAIIDILNLYGLSDDTAEELLVGILNQFYVITPLYNFIHDNQMTKALISEPSQEYLILL